MPTDIWCAIISGGVTLIVAILTFQITVKKDRMQQRQDLREEIKKIQENDLREIRDDITNMGANLQQKIVVVELELGHTRNDITTLSDRVEKHNNVIERVYKLEQRIADIS